MKNQFILSLLTAALFLCAGSAGAQQRYKHLKRVRVQPGQHKTLSAPESPESSPVTIPDKPLIAPASEVERSWNEVVVAADDETAAIVSDNRKEEKNHRRNVFASSIKDNTTVEPVGYDRSVHSVIQELKEHRYMKRGPLDTEQTHLARWLTIMIILYSVGFLFLILGIVFSVTVAYPIGLICYLLFALCWIAATIILILGLVGVMS